MFCLQKDCKSQPLEAGVSRKILAHAGKMMIVEVKIAGGVTTQKHSHPHEQASYIVSGKFEVTLGDEKQILTAGDTFYAPPDLPHFVAALEDSVILDIFTPQREDFLAAPAK